MQRINIRMPAWPMSAGLIWCSMLLWIALASVPASAQGSWSIAGKVVDDESGEGIAGATVRLMSDSTPAAKQLRGGISDADGSFRVRDVPAGRYLLLIHSIGYATLSRPIDLGPRAADHLDLRLHREDIRAGEVTVETRRQMAAGNAGAVDLRSEFVARMPSLGGEADIFRALQLMPGVKSLGEISSGLYVRGGSPDENLTLIDGTVIYNPSHVGGFLSSFNNDAVRDVKLVKGAFPAEYGGRLSSVLDVAMRDGTEKGISGVAGLSMLSSRLMLRGPISSDATFMIAGRRMYLDLVAPFIPAADTIPRYYFYDLNGKIGWRLSDRDRLSISGYTGRDNLASNPDERFPYSMVWGNSVGTARWDHAFSPGISLATSAGYSGYSVENISRSRDSLGAIRSTYRSGSDIRDISLRSDLVAMFDSTNTLKTGFEAIVHRTGRESGYQSSGSADTLRPAIADATECGLYVQEELHPIDALTLTYGGRISWFSNGAYLAAEPRTSLSYALAGAVRLTAAFSLAQQYMHLVSRNDLPLPNDTWFISSPERKPEVARQGSLGFEWDLLDDMFLLSAEGYYKRMNNLYDYRVDADFSSSSPLDSNLVHGDGSAYGVELFLNKKIGPVTGWIGYTLSWTTRTFADLNGGREFYPRYDRRHDISIVASYRLNNRWEFSATWTYATGQPYTSAAGEYTFPGLQDENQGGIFTMPRLDYPGVNTHRLPAFHKMDLNATYSFAFLDIPWQCSINIYNAYNHRNIFSQYIDSSTVRNSATGQVTPRLDIHRITLFPIIPTVGLSCSF